MRKNNGIIIYDLDMYSNRIGFFSNNRERIGSNFGLFLTLIYILASLVIFIIYSIDTIGRKEMRVYDSNVYSNTTPSIEINSNDVNFAFGLEDPISSNKYIDPSIYYPEIVFIDRIKNEDGEFKTVERKELKYERCKNSSFGENNIFGDIKLGNSYCLEDFNITLSGGYKYNRMSYIRIKIMPCSNKTGNSNCKPQEVIDKYLTRGYLSILLKDIGLNPANYSIPVIPTLQNLYTTIDKRIFRELVINYGITEIQTDTGLFYEHINKKKYLKYNSGQETFYLRSNEELSQGKQICVIQIRLDDTIHIQKRTYKKIPEIFSLIGGYMQLLSTVFSLISILTNLDLEVKILNNLFNFNLKQNKMTIKINNIRDFNTNKHRSYKHFPYISKKSLLMKKFKKQYSKHLNNNNISKNNLLNNDNTNNNDKIILPIINKINKSHLLEEKLADNSQNILNSNNISADNNKKSLFNQNKNIKNSDISLSMRTKSLKGEKKVYLRPVSVYTDSFRLSYKDIFNNNNNDDNDKNINLNLINYYCCGNICKKKKHIELFDIGVSLYRKRMDIINVFTILLLTEKILLKIERQKITQFNNENLDILQNLNK